MTGKRLAEARRWFQQAFYDLEAARWNLKGGFNNTVCFLAEQALKAAEKIFDMVQGYYEDHEEEGILKPD
jgi:HEPN domain-containing protein